MAALYGRKRATGDRDRAVQTFRKPNPFVCYDSLRLFRRPTGHVISSRQRELLVSVTWVVSLLVRSINQKYVVAVVYVCGMMMNSLDSTAVTVALPTLAREFGLAPTEIEAVVIAYLVSLAVFIPSSGWVGDRFGTKRTLLFAMAMFTGASMLCGAAQSFDQLVFFRVLQGAGGGLLTPVGMAMLYRTFPPEERVGVGRVLMFATIIGPAMGPILGGFLVEHFSWRWIFYINMPVGLFAFTFGLLCLKEHREHAPGRFDLPGFVTGGLGLALLMFALSEGPRKGWTSPTVAATFILGVAILATFVWIELRVSEPMVKLRLLTNRLFRSTLTVSFFASASFLGALFLTPLFLQEAHGASPLQSGLATFPEALGVVTSTQIVARLYPRVGPRRLMTAGLVWVGIDLMLFGLVDVNTNLWVVRALMFGLGVGMSYIFLPNQAANQATISRSDTGRASTLASVQRQVGAALGVALVSTVLTIANPISVNDLGIGVPNMTAYRAGFVVAACLAFIGAFFALRVPDEDAAVTMVQKPGVQREPAAAHAD